MGIWLVYAATWGTGEPFKWGYFSATDEEISGFCLRLLADRESAPGVWAVPIKEPTEYELTQVRPTGALRTTIPWPDKYTVQEWNRDLGAWKEAGSFQTLEGAESFTRTLQGETIIRQRCRECPAWLTELGAVRCLSCGKEQG